LQKAEGFSFLFNVIVPSANLSTSSRALKNRDCLLELMARLHSAAEYLVCCETGIVPLVALYNLLC
jgi:hypothetical protein